MMPPMIWLIKKIIFWTVVGFLIFWLLKMPYNGRPLKDYVLEFYHAPLIQEGIRFGKQFGKEQIQKLLEKKDEKPMENLNDKDRQKLDGILKKESR